MPMTSLRALSLALAAMIAACGTPTMHSQTPPSTVIDVKDRKPPVPVPRRNPNPTAYEVVMTIGNAPGPFGSIKGFMQYDTPRNDPCQPDLGGMAGTRMHLSESIPVQYEKIGENTYRAIVYTDLLVDEDYFGLGVCRWSLVATRVELQATGAEGETVFFENVFHDDLIAKDRIKVYFNRAWYPRDEVIPDMSIPGEDKVTFFRADVRDNLFTLDFRVRKLKP